MTSVGSIDRTRRGWKCRNGDEGGGYLADQLLGIAGSLSRRLQQHIGRLGAKVSFAKTQRWLKDIKSVPIGAETGRLCCERHEAKMAAWQPTDEATAAGFARTEGDVEFLVDAGKVNTREAGWNDLKIPASSVAHGPSRPRPRRGVIATCRGRPAGWPSPRSPRRSGFDTPGGGRPAGWECVARTGFMP